MWIKLKKNYINLQKAARISGYSSDYIGYLIRKGKIEGKRIYTNSSWRVSSGEIIEYCQKIKDLDIRDRLLLKKKHLSLKEVAQISGYAPDYIGYLIRKGKISGKKVYSGPAWLTTEEALKKYQKKSKIKSIREQPIARLVYDIFPPEKIKEAAREITGLKPYKTKFEKIFAIGWRLSLAGIILFLLIGIGPIEIFQKIIGAFTEETKTVNFYSTLCQGDPEGIPAGSYGASWQNPQNVQGEPNIGPDGDFDSFSEANSAVYQGGSLDLVCQNFDTNEELKNLQFQSAKIKFSFAIGEKIVEFTPLLEKPILEEPISPLETVTPPEEGIKPEELPIEEVTPSEEELIQPQQESLPTSFWNKVKNFFGTLTIKAQEEILPIEIVTPSQEGITNQQEENEPDTENLPPEVGPLPVESESSQNETAENSSPPIETVTQPMEGIQDVLPNLDAKIIIWYSLNGEDWQTLETISTSPLSNFSNGGDFSFEAPFLKNWEDVKNLKIKFEGVVGGETNFVAYLDSVWIEAQFKEKPPEPQKIFKIKIKDNSLIISQIEKDFSANEEPIFIIEEPELPVEELITIEKEKLEVLEEIEIPGNENQKGLLEKVREEILEPLQNLIAPNEIGAQTQKVKTKILKPDGQEFDIIPEVNSILKNGKESFEIKIPKTKKELQPGFYKLQLEFETKEAIYILEQDFTWGLLAINTNKSIYLSSEALAKEGLPNETAYLQMAALKNDGHTICDANLKLEITSPSGDPVSATVERSGECGPNNVTNVPDYFAYYQVGEIGEYEMKLKNLDNGYEITDSFEVRESVPFDVERIGPTRIYPLAVYEMTLRIKANQDFIGEIVETTPESFEIRESGSPPAQIREGNGGKEIVWQVDWKEGENYELKYQFDAPNISPYLYLLGPLRLTESGSPLAVFEEARQWQLASDAIAFAQNVCTANSKSSGTSISCTVPVAGVAQNNRIIIYFAMDDATTNVTATDTQSNTYSNDIDVTNAAGVRTVILSANATTALVSGNTITVTHPSVTARAMSVDEFSGVATANALDQTTSATGSSASPSSGNVTTTSADELLIGAIGVEGPIGDSFTQGTNWTIGTRDGTSGGGAAGNITIDPEYRIVSATGTYTADGTITDRDWATAIATYKMTITVSGNAYEDETSAALVACDGTTNMITLRTGGATYGPVPCADLDGAFTISNVAQPSIGDPMIIWIDGVASNFGSNINRGSGSGNVTGIAVRRNRVIVQHDDGGPVTNANMDTWDNDNDADINYVVTAGALTVEAGSKLIINTSDTFTPGGTVTLTDGGADPSGDLLVMTGATLNGTNNVTVNGGDATGDGTISLTGGTFTLDGAGNFGGATAWTFYNLTIGGNATVETTTATGAGGITVTNVLTIGANQTLDAGSKTWTLSGTGTPFVKTGTFSASTSTFVYSGATTTNVTSTTYYNLNIGGAATTTTYTAAGNITVNSVLTIVSSSGTNTFDASSYTITLSGTGTPFVISATEVFTASTSTIAYTGATTATNVTSTTYYNLNLGGAATTTTYTAAGDITVTSILTIVSSTGTNTFDASSYTITLSSSGTPFVISATEVFTPSTSTVKYLNNSSGAANVTATTYNNLEILPGSGGVAQNEIIRPNNAGSECNIPSQSGCSACPNHYDCVYEDIADEDTTRVGSDETGTYSRDLYALQNSTASGPIGSVTVYFRCRKVVMGSAIARAKPAIKSGANIEEGIPRTQTTSWTTDNWTCNNDPNTGGGTCATGNPWTWSAIDTLEAGVSVVGSYIDEFNSSTARCTQVYVEVNYFEPTYNLGTAASQTITTNGYLTIGDGTNLVQVDGDTYNPTLNISGNFTISANATLDAGSGTWTLSNSGTPFLISGTFNAQTSTFKYTANAATNITATTYNNLELSPSANLITFTLGTAASQTINTNGYLTIGNGTNTGTITAATNNPVLNVDGNFTISANATLTASATAIFSVAGNWSNSATGTFTHSSGTVTFDATTTGKTISDGGSPFYNIEFTGDNGGWTYTDSASTAPNATTVNCTSCVAIFLNAKTGTSPTVTNGTLNVDWYLGVHVVDAAVTSTNIDTGDADITISENSGTPQSTVWRYSAGWGSGATSQTTGSGADGKNPQPTSTGAIRIREYSKTSGGTTYYLYNLQIVEQPSYGAYNYYTDYGSKYLTSTANAGSGHDEVIGVNWYRSAAGTMNTPYVTVNEPPTNGSWYVGMSSGITLTVDLTGASIDFGTLDSTNNFSTTAGTQTNITVSTSATSGYIVTAWETQLMTCSNSGYCGSENIQNFTYGTYANPQPWGATDYCKDNANYCGFGFTSNDTSVEGSNRYNGATEYTFFPTDSSAPVRVMDYPSSVTNQSYLITYRISAPLTQRSGPYGTTIVYIVTAQF